MKRQPKASAEDKRAFEEALMKTIYELFEKSFTKETCSGVIPFYDQLSIVEKRRVWDEMTTRLQKPRQQIYKFYNNTFKANVMLPWPLELLDQMSYAAALAAENLANDPAVSEDQAIKLGVEHVKQQLRVREYANFHQETAHHKIRNAFLPVFREVRHRVKTEMLVEGLGGQKAQNSNVLRANTANASQKLQEQNSTPTSPPRPETGGTAAFLKAADSFEADAQQNRFVCPPLPSIPHCSTQDCIPQQPLQQAKTSDFVQCPCSWPQAAPQQPVQSPALPPLLPSVTDSAWTEIQMRTSDQQFKYSDCLFSNPQPTQANVLEKLVQSNRTTIGTEVRSSRAIYDGEDEIFEKIEYQSGDEDMGLDFA